MYFANKIWNILVYALFVGQINLVKNMRLSKGDPNSYSTPENEIVEHVDLDWTVDFDKQILKGSALLKFKIVAKSIKTIFLDVNDVNISSISVKSSAGDFPVTFFISDPVKEIGSKLTIELPTETDGNLNLLIEYETMPTASALQWLTPEQTLGKQHPYLFSQCQAIHARSILPIQDSPAVKFTYNAVLRYPEELTALMSAVIDKSEKGKTTFRQETPIPAYLLAIAVGKLVSRRLGPISDVWGEEAIIDAAAYEFADTSKYLDTASEICGPYVWKRYDILVMPPSFPYGGMENPCLTFVTPTLLAGDRSLATVVAHEIAHSWTGNLVTNRNFEHFWLNEGFTVFVEGKIVGKLKGDLYRDFHAIQGLSDLKECIDDQLAKTPELTKLIVDLTNLGPDDAFSSVPYMKGSTFLRYIEDSLGGPTVMDPFLKFYLNKYKFQSILTDDFRKTLYDFFKGNTTSENALQQIDWELWTKGEGMPPIIPKYDNTVAEISLRHTKLWAEKPTSEIPSSAILNETLTSEQIIEFMSKLLEKKDIIDLGEDKVNLLASTYKIENTQNAEIRFRFLKLVIRARVMSKMNEIIAFANSNFRMKFVRPIYRALGSWPEGRPIAIANFNKVRNQMMKVCSYTIEKDLGL